MKKVIATYYDKKLHEAHSLYSGLVFELEDGTFVVHSQDGYVKQLDTHTKEELEKLRQVESDEKH